MQPRSDTIKLQQYKFSTVMYMNFALRLLVRQQYHFDADICYVSHAMPDFR
jgi:hypothetical protein